MVSGPLSLVLADIRITLRRVRLWMLRLLLNTRRPALSLAVEIPKPGHWFIGPAQLDKVGRPRAAVMRLGFAVTISQDLLKAYDA
jgi:hypothetical protein